MANQLPAIANNLTAGQSEDTVGVEGLININTAPWPVLAQLPFYGTALAGTPAQNAVLAKKIVDYRTTHGPFQSVLDLYRVLDFVSANGALISSAAGPAQGVFSPGGIGPSAITPIGTARYDFQEHFLLFNNISNLITTRSDVFTCYVLLQGWRNVGSANPTLAVQRRAAFIIDRNGITPANSTPVVFKLPAD